MADKLTVYNNAILLTGGEMIAALTSGVKARRLCDQFWNSVILETLSVGAWKFAMRSQQISSDADVTPQFGYTAAFTFPIDSARPYLVSANETMNPPLDDYAREGKQLFANFDPIFFRYVSNDKSYGFDLGQWPALFTRAIETLLAERICPGLTESEEKLQRITKQRAEARAKALNEDAFNEPVKRPRAGRWVTARAGSRGSGLDPNRIIPT